MRWITIASLLAALAGGLSATTAGANDRTAVVIGRFTPVAYTSEPMAEQAAARVRSALAESGEVDILDRDELGAIIEERTLGASLARPDAPHAQSQGVRGADYLLGGSVLLDGFRLHVFGTLTRVDDGTMTAFTVSGGDGVDLGALAERVSRRSLEIIRARSSEERPTLVTYLSRTAALAAQLDGRTLPALSVDIEETHFTRRVIDPAAETEFLVFAGEAGFPLVDTAPAFREFVDVRVTGEGFTEVSYRQGAAFGITARLEVKAVSLRNGRVLAVDRETSVVLASSELIGSKNALARASAAIAERMLPKLAPATP